MRHNTFDFPRIFIAGLRGGAGKTTLSIGIIAAWRKSGKSIAPYKKGPDYIDAGWLALAAGRPCYNLDTFLMENRQVLASFVSHTRPGDIAVIEGNRGLYDGIDIHGHTSSAEVAKLLKTPVVLCVDATKTTRTLAAIVSGCIHFDPDLSLKGIILNRVAGSRHEQNIRTNIEHHCGIPVLGAVPRLDDQNFPERHMGLIPTPEHELAIHAVDVAADVARRYLDLDAIAEIAAGAGTDTAEMPEAASCPAISLSAKPRIGIIRDAAFQFYYPENIEALEIAGAETVFFSAYRDRDIPDVDAIYIGGGFPETHARELSENEAFREKLKALAGNGLPIYAECGGLMYLGEALDIDGRRYPMCGVLPVVFGLGKKPQGLGYTVVSVDRENLWFKKGSEIRGHEFRYSRVLEWRGTDMDMVFNMKRGTGFINGRDGIARQNIFATYTHIHALGVSEWAKTMVTNAMDYRLKKGK